MAFSPAAAALAWRVLQIRRRRHLAAARRRLLDIEREQQQQLQLATAIILAGAQKGAYGRRVVERNEGGWKLSTINSYVENGTASRHVGRHHYVGAADVLFAFVAAAAISFRSSTRPMERTLYSLPGTHGPRARAGHSHSALPLARPVALGRGLVDVVWMRAQRGAHTPHSTVAQRARSTLRFSLLRSRAGHQCCPAPRRRAAAAAASTAAASSHRR